jgi:hypothetical protein
MRSNTTVSILESGRIRETLKTLVAQLESAYVELIRLLRLAAAKGLYAAWGHASLSAYVERELNLPRKDLCDLFAVGRRADVLGIAKEKLNEMGFKRAREILLCGKDPQMLEALVDRSKITPPSGVRTVPGVKPPPGSNPDYEFVEVRFWVSRSQANFVRLALKVASEISGSSKPGWNLELICLDFVSGAMINGQVDKGGLGNLLRLFELVFEVEILVARGDKIIFGEKFLARLQEKEEMEKALATTGVDYAI